MRFGSRCCSAAATRFRVAMPCRRAARDVATLRHDARDFWPRRRVAALRSRLRCCTATLASQCHLRRCRTAMLRRKTSSRCRILISSRNAMRFHNAASPWLHLTRFDGGLAYAAPVHVVRTWRVAVQGSRRKRAPRNFRPSARMSPAGRNANHMPFTGGREKFLSDFPNYS